MTDPKYAYRRTDIATGESKHWIGKPGGRIQPTSKESFVMMNQAACREIATNYELQGFDLRLFIFLTGILDAENWVDIHHGRLARQMSADTHTVSRPQITKALGRLTTEGLLLKGAERTYRLPPSIGWKGDRRAQVKAEKDAAKGRLSLVRP